MCNPPRARLDSQGFSWLVTSCHALLGKTLAKLIAARLRIGVRGPVACDVEHGADVAQRLLIEPALAPRPLHRVAIGCGLARAEKDVAAFVVVDQPLHLARQGGQRLHVQHDHGGGDGEALEIPEQRLGAAAGEPASLDDETAGRNEPVLLDGDGGRVGTSHEERKQKRKSGPQAGSRPHVSFPCCP